MKIGNAEKRCLNKMTFSGSKEAIQYVKEMFSRPNSKVPRNKQLRPYRCPLCDNYHLSSKSKKEVRHNKAKTERRLKAHRVRINNSVTL